ncbi:MAG: Asp-tRNA(Asn)/Glu-tRNA(Gln) amidotransferase subunit GatA, partial [Halanaerobiaceae bacterium]
MEITELGLKELKDKIVSGELVPEEVLTAYRERIDEVDDRIKAYVTVTGKEAEEMLEEINPAEAELAGIPVGVKDNMSTEGVRTTCSSKMLEDYVPPFDATAVKKLKEAGGTILGKTNMDEYAMGSSTENSAFFPSHNPWNMEHVTGGSSGGSAAAVAAGECPAALGSDTGGSIRQPAAFCGVFGLKPTYGLVSRYGLIAYASSLDQIGPITRNVEDAALLLNVISGHDPLDSTSVDRDYPDYMQYLKNNVEDLKIGLPAGYFNLDFSAEVKEAVLGAVNKLEEAGATVEEVELTEAEYALAAYYIIAPAEASSNLARYDGVRYGHRSEKTDNVKTMFTATRNEGFGDEVKRRIMLGTYALSSGYYDDFYLKAQKVRTLIMEDYQEL